MTRTVLQLYRHPRHKKTSAVWKRRLESKKKTPCEPAILEKGKKEKDCEMDEDEFYDNDAKVSYYTGLSHNYFDAVSYALSIER